MRLTLITETYAPQVNGVSRTLDQLVRHMVDAGDSVQVVHPDYGETVDAAGHVTTRSISLPWYKDVRLPVPPFRSVLRRIDAFRPDVVHIATEATLGLVALRHARRRGYPVVSSFHTNWDHYSDHYRVSFARGLVWRYLRWFHARTIETYVPSRPTIADLEARGFRDLVLWPRGVEARLFRPDRVRRGSVRASFGFGPGDVVIGHVSRLAPEKNVGYLADALAIVGEARPSARFLFVGDGPERAGLERRMGPNARFAGYRSGDDLADHYAASDAFAFASLTETFGNVVLEAMASGLPVVAVRAGGVSDIVRQGGTGLLVEQGDPPAKFAEGLVRLIDDIGLRRDLADAARAYALTQTWGAIMGSLRDRYAAIVERSGARKTLITV
ncbi:MAG TPA: glycosyltransferase family 1 protein [Isosphaeraceae bacterium]